MSQSTEEQEVHEITDSNKHIFNLRGSTSYKTHCYLFTLSLFVTQNLLLTTA